MRVQAGAHVSVSGPGHYHRRPIQRLNAITEASAAGADGVQSGQVLVQVRWPTRSVAAFHQTNPSLQPPARPAKAKKPVQSWTGSSAEAKLNSV
jgi:hypothetical protein